ncbi:MAG: DsbA family oxidoreductase [Burkholderiaceae bacterium]
MHPTLKIDFVSDVSCPWCAIGLQSLEVALERLKDEVQVDIHFQPFELNPKMGAEGQDITEHLNQKYGATPEQAAAARENIRQRGEALGFTFNMDKRARIYNTFDAHRLLHWAETSGQQLALKKALFTAYFTNGEDPSNHDVLLRAVRTTDLDVDEAQRVLATDDFAAEVREQEQFFLDQGIHSVPAVVINDRHLISGGQPPEVFEQALRQLATQA